MKLNEIMQLLQILNDKIIALVTKLECVEKENEFLKELVKKQKK